MTEINSRALRALNTASIDWRDDQPYSRTFSDVYFSSVDACRETQHVFIDANRLTERWGQLDDNASFTIVETGFGAGLNFLTSAQLWLEQGPKNGLLHFASIEKHPLSREDFARAIKAWPQFVSISEQLIEQYPPPIPGFHRIYLDPVRDNPASLQHQHKDQHRHRIALTLIFADAEQALTQLRQSEHPGFRKHRQFSVDAWFLDGFAPANNPEMWTTDIYQAIADLSDTQTSLSTFTAATLVRRGLEEVGFKLNKISGYGLKREMLKGQFGAEAIKAEPKPELKPELKPESRQDSKYRRKSRVRLPPPWHIDARKDPSLSSPTAQRNTIDNNQPKQAAIIGAGIAGCSTAFALAQRGWEVTLYDPAGSPGAGASGNSQGIIYPRLSPEASFLSRFNLSALAFATRFYSRFWDQSDTGGSPINGSRCGILVLPEQSSDQKVFAKIAANFDSCDDFVSLLDTALNVDEIQAISGVDLDATTALYFPSLGWIKPQKICEQLTHHKNIQLQQARIEHLIRDIANDRWLLKTDNPADNYSAKTAVLATSYQSKGFDAAQHLPLKAIRGQISISPATSASQALKTVVCGAGYLAPASSKVHSFGATYHLNDSAENVRDRDHLLNLETLALTDPTLPSLLGQPSISTLTGRAALRCTTPDYLPVLGRAPNFERFLEDFAPLRQDARADIALAGSYWPDLYIHCGLGSRGFTYAPLGAELLAGLINKEVPVLPVDLQMALHPGRFIIRDLKRQRV